MLLPGFVALPPLSEPKLVLFFNKLQIIMKTQELIAKLFYTLGDIQTNTGNERIRVMAEAMQITAMEMNLLSLKKGKTMAPSRSLPSKGDDSL